jgi:chromosome segregation ATPase
MRLIGHFIKDGSKMTLEIQNEMVNGNKSLDQTAAGRELEDKLAQERAKFIKQLQEVESDLRKALEKKDQDTAKALEEIKRENQHVLSELRREHESLRVSMERLHEEMCKHLPTDYRVVSEALRFNNPNPIFCEE